MLTLMRYSQVQEIPWVMHYAWWRGILRLASIHCYVSSSAESMSRSCYAFMLDQANLLL